MLLAIDIGNSQTALGVRAPGAWLALWRARSDSRRTADETAILFRSFLEEVDVTPGDIDGVVMGSVVPALTAVVAETVSRLFDIQPLIVAPGIKTGLPVRYQPEGSLGGDRLADAVAAKELMGSPAIVVDFGTATTLNVVDGNGVFIGGAIAPGVGLAAAALAASGARLTPVDLASHPAPAIVGRNTAESMRSGILYGCASLVEGLLARFDLELAATPPVVATGGMAPAMAPLVKRVSTVEPFLTLDGLRLIAERNA